MSRKPRKRLVAQRLVHAALHDAEQRVRDCLRARACERSAQRSDSCIESRACVVVAGYGVHSSNTITMSELSTRWMRIDSSGVRKHASPLTGDWKLHALFGDLAQRAEAEHLKAAGVGEDRARPSP